MGLLLLLLAERADLRRLAAAFRFRLTLGFS
jgi:hypothetical protein